MILTSSYNGCDSSKFRTFSISGDRGKRAQYVGPCYPKLAPKLSFWEKWHENIGVVSEEKNNRYYIEEYYKQVLANLDPQQVYDELEHSILLCYEDNDEFCHRHIVAAWLELFLGVEIAEVVVTGYKIEKVKRPEHIKLILEETIKKNKNMRGFHSLRALYLFDRSEHLENKATELEERSSKFCDNYRQMACFLRCDADEEEAKYISQIKSTKKK